MVNEDEYMLHKTHACISSRGCLCSCGLGATLGSSLRFRLLCDGLGSRSGSVLLLSAPDLRLTISDPD